MKWWFAAALLGLAPAFAQEAEVGFEAEGARQTEALEELLTPPRLGFEDGPPFSITFPEAPELAPPEIEVGPVRPSFSTGYSPKRVISPEEEKVILRELRDFIGSRELVRALSAETTDECAAAREAYALALSNDEEFVVKRKRPDLVLAVDRACTSRPQSAPWWATVERRIGVLIDARQGESRWGVDIFCTAYALDSTTVATAGHCAYEPMPKSVNSSAIRDVGEILFIPAAAPVEARRIIGMTKPDGATPEREQFRRRQASDVIYLKLDPQTPLPSAITTLSPASSLPRAAPLVLVGFNPELAYFSNSAETAPPLASLPRDVRLTPETVKERLPRTWTDFLRYDPREMCRAWVVVADTCILHTCLTVGGFSGAPTFQNESGALTYVGPHAGFVGEDDTSTTCTGGGLQAAALRGQRANLAVAARRLDSSGDGSTPNDR